MDAEGFYDDGCNLEELKMGKETGRKMILVGQRCSSREWY